MVRSYVIEYKDAGGTKHRRVISPSDYPNAVAMVHQYKKMGFEVIRVQLLTVDPKQAEARFPSFAGKGSITIRWTTERFPTGPVLTGIGKAPNIEKVGALINQLEKNLFHWNVGLDSKLMGGHMTFAGREKSLEKAKAAVMRVVKENSDKLGAFLNHSQVGRIKFAEYRGAKLGARQSRYSLYAYLAVADYWNSQSDPKGIIAFQKAKRDAIEAKRYVKSEVWSILDYNEQKLVVYGQPRFIEFDSDKPAKAEANFIVPISGPADIIKKIVHKLSGFSKSGKIKCAQFGSWS